MYNASMPPFRTSPLDGKDALMFPLMKKFAEEGVMPNFAGMMKEGCFCEALPFIPAWTPTNWATIAIGAYVGTRLKKARFYPCNRRLSDTIG